jgi:hypothetical protein
MNIPLATIRNNYSRLDKARRYIVYCDTGRRSAAAAFLLVQRGFDAAVLEGGLNQGVPDKSMTAASGTPQPPAPTSTPVPQAATHRPAATDKPAPAKGNAQLIERLQRELGVLRGELENYADKARQLETAYLAEHKARKQLVSRVENLLARLKPAAGSKR